MLRHQHCFIKWLCGVVEAGLWVVRVGHGGHLLAHLLADIFPTVFKGEWLIRQSLICIFAHYPREDKYSQWTKGVKPPDRWWQMYTHKSDVMNNDFLIIYQPSSVQSNRGCGWDLCISRSLLTACLSWVSSEQFYCGWLCLLLSLLFPFSWYVLALSGRFYFSLLL